MARRYLERGVQLAEREPACEVLYKGAREALKAAAVALDMREAKAREGGWTFVELKDVAMTLGDRYGGEVVRWWVVVMALYDLCIVEGVANREDIELSITDIQKLVKLLDTISNETRR
ncbi:MAG: PaREP1 family protein [Pyrobaculum sp.]